METADVLGCATGCWHRHLAVLPPFIYGCKYGGQLRRGQQYGKIHAHGSKMSGALAAEKVSDFVAKTVGLRLISWPRGWATRKAIAQTMICERHCND